MSLSGLLAHICGLVATGKSQFIITTHSPVLLTFPGAQILSFDGDAPHPMSLEDTSHFQNHQRDPAEPRRLLETPSGNRSCRR